MHFSLNLCRYFVQTYVEFLIAGVVIGLVLGGSQALSRAIFAKMVPKGYEVRQQRRVL